MSSPSTSKNTAATAEGRVIHPGRGGDGAALDLSGVRKATLWLLSVDEDLATQTLSKLEPDEVRKIYEAAAQLDGVPPEHLSAVHSEFGRAADRELLRLRGSGEYLKRLATRALGDRVANVLRSAEEQTITPPLRRVEPVALAAMLAQEHPQTIAAIVASLDQPQGVAVLNQLPSELRGDVILRIGRLQKVPRAALREVERVLAAGLPTEDDADNELDGVRVAASLLNKLRSDDSDRILQEAQSSAPDITEKIRRAMFTFEDLLELDRKGFQLLLKEVPSDQLLIALKTASQELRDKIFSTLSKRAGEMLRDDLELLGPQRVSDVEKAQQAIAAVAMQLRADGKIAFGAGGEGYV